MDNLRVADGSPSCGGDTELPQRSRLSHARSPDARPEDVTPEVTPAPLPGGARHSGGGQRPSAVWTSWTSFGGSTFKNLLHIRTSARSGRSSFAEDSNSSQATRPSHAASGSDRAGVGKVKPTMLWRVWGQPRFDVSTCRSDVDDEASPTAGVQRNRRARLPRAARRLNKLEKLQLARTASRRIEMQHRRVQFINSPAGGGFLRYGALRFADTGGAPTVWSAVAAGAPDASLGAIRWNLWHLARPHVLISLAGLDAGTSALTARTEGLLLAGLTRAVRTTGAWVLSPGTRDSAAALVDRLVDGWEDERAPPVCIGLLPWGKLPPSLARELHERPAGTCYVVPPEACLLYTSPSPRDS